MSKHYWESPFIDWHKVAPENWDIYVCQIRDSRNKAYIVAVKEILSTLVDCDPIALLSGPLADRKGIHWIGVDVLHREYVKEQVKFLGYTNKVFRLIAADEQPHDCDYEDVELVRWHRKNYWLLPIYSESPSWIRNRAPDKRTFLLKNNKDEVVSVKGYRGDSNELSRRGLPPEDARVLVNLVTLSKTICRKCDFLDPFAGVGGLAIEAVDKQYHVVSGDIDSVVQYGLHNITHHHVVLDTGQLPFQNESFWSIASELPFHKQIETKLENFIYEMHRVLKYNGKMALMLVKSQLAILEKKAFDLELKLVLSANINRKGTDVWISVWEKT